MGTLVVGVSKTTRNANCTFEYTPSPMLSGKVSVVDVPVLHGAVLLSPNTQPRVTVALERRNVKRRIATTNQRSEKDEAFAARFDCCILFCCVQPKVGCFFKRGCVYRKLASAM